jgi:hypothetical protein
VSYYFLNAENSFEIDQNVLGELKVELESNPTGKVDQIWKVCSTIFLTHSFFFLSFK